jgi:fructosamine-3-kinase
LGGNLNKVINSTKLKNKEIKNIIHKLGKIIKKIHEIRTYGYGTLKHFGINFFNNTFSVKFFGKEKYWHSFIEKEFQDNLNAILKSSLLPSSLLNKVENCYFKNKKTADCIESKLLHGDLHFDNVLILNSNISIIDPRILCGDPLYDIGIIHLDNLYSNRLSLMKDFYESYGHAKINQDKINFYAFINTIRRIAFNKTDSKLIQCLKYYLEELG